MDCSLLQVALCAYIDDELDSHQRASVEDHLLACEACTSEVASLRAARALVSRLRRHEADPPSTLRLLPDDPSLLAAPGARPRWWRRPIHGRYGLVAVAAAVIALLAVYPRYESRFHARRAQRSVVAAYLAGTSSLIMGEPSPAQTIVHRPTAIPPMGQGEVFAVPQGLVDCGGVSALHTVYLVGPHTVSQFRFEPGGFRDANLSPTTINGRSCRIGELNGFSIASYRYGSGQVVLVTAGPPEVLLFLARSIPPDTPSAPLDAGR